MDKEMIERVAKASFDCWNNHRGLPYSIEDMSDIEKVFAKVHAVAIIKAMREPTEKMVDAAQNWKGQQSYTDIWQAMIDAVIND